MRLFTTLLVLSFAVSAFAQVTKQERAGIVNFSKVDAVVACGGATETSALEGLAKDGFKSVINLRQASEANANIEQNSARAKELGLKYIHIPFNTQQLDPKVIDQFLAAIADKSNQPAYRSLRFGQQGWLGLACEASDSGWLDDREGHGRSKGDRTARRAAREVCARLHRGAEKVMLRGLRS